MVSGRGMRCVAAGKARRFQLVDEASDVIAFVVDDVTAVVLAQEVDQLTDVR